MAMNGQIKRQFRITRYVIYKEFQFDWSNHLITFIGAFLGLSLIGLIHQNRFSSLENVFLIGSFGASSVLIYGAVKSPFSQPRNLIGGHIISALIGVTIYQLFPDQIWIAGPLAVALAIVAMQITKTVHPPGGATALIAVIGTPKVKALGYLYVLSPVLSGVLILFVVALIVNNMSKTRRYPSSGVFTKSLRRMDQLTGRRKKI